MGKVLVVAKVLPNDINLNLEQIYQSVKNQLPQNVELKGYKIEPVAFGLNALKLYLAIPDNTEGGTSKIEEFLSQINGVEQVEIEFVSLI
ncbi:MAG TPA: elongation factor 1-beta [Geobacterales bacterium]|nr:elongation factor 1-beta [Geobacterales bacterium]